MIPPDAEERAEGRADWRANPEVRSGTAVWLILLACGMIGLGSVLLGLQVVLGLA